MLHRRGAGHRIVGVSEHDEPAVTLTTRPNREAAVGRNRLLDRHVVLTQRLQHRIGRLFEQPGASLHVGEQEGDDTLGKTSHVKSLRGRTAAAQIAHRLDQYRPASSVRDPAIGIGFATSALPYLRTSA